MTDDDTVPSTLAEYVTDPSKAAGSAALEGARLVLLDSLACAFLGLDDPECRRVVAPAFPLEGPAFPRILGTTLRATPADAAFGTTTALRWLDFNDAWLAREWGHPSDNLGALLAVADRLALQARARQTAPPSVADVLVALVQTHEIQGLLALETSLNAHGYDHVLFVKVASAAVTCRMLGGGVGAVRRAVQHAFADVGPLRVYRHAGNVGPRKSWAAGDAAARGVHLAGVALRDETDYPRVLSQPRWGFSDVVLGGEPVALGREPADFVMRNVLLKPAWPAEFHGQTAIEAAIGLHPTVADRLDEVETIRVDTHEAAVRIIDKTGPLRNAADRDHCLQYMVAYALVHGRVDVRAYGDEAAADPRLDALRERIAVREEPAYTEAYHDPSRRYQPNAVEVAFRDGSVSQRVEVLAPIGHPERRAEAVPHVMSKLRAGVAARFDDPAAEAVLARLTDEGGLEATPVDELCTLLTTDLRRP